MPLESLLTKPNPEVPRSRSLLSHFSSPLSKHARAMFELAVEPDDPFKVYSPGEPVKGHIVLTVLKGFDVTHLVVALHGFAKVYKHQVMNGDGLNGAECLVNGKGTKGFEYLGNGMASLFQEEQVLCGTGFLKKQVYKFAFELQFPAKSMPSTIDFERGTVSYMISATLTRPVTIAPTHVKVKRIRFQDSIDIESMNTPKSRVISLEPVSRRGKVKKVRPPVDGPSLSRRNTNASTVASPTTADPPLSPAPSEDTLATATSRSSQSFQQIEEDVAPARRASPQASDTRSTTTSSSLHTITATTELPRHGALPGDSIPVRVHIQHTKGGVRGVVIATLYRMSRIDMHPAIPLAHRGKDKKAEYEDIYPKSRTGLGGLYFASSSPSSIYRMDLSQSSTMMVVDPTNLTSDITTSVKVPDAAFPSIANVPGGMISFTYHVEVVIDLFGKLGEPRYLPRLTSSDPTFTPTADAGNQLTSEWSNNILDTSHLRRMRGVVTFEMSVTVGTTDSSRKKWRRQVEPVQDGIRASGQDEQGYDEQHYGDGYNGYDDYWYYDEHGNAQYYDPSDYDGYSHYYEGYERHHQNGHPDQTVPPPEPEEVVDEKTKLRRQEQLLLPSQPPQEAESSGSAVTHHFAPSAPSAPALEGQGDEQRQDPRDGVAAPSTPGPPASVVSARSMDTMRPTSASPPPVPSFGEDAAVAPTDDKQELERRRLMAQASAPLDEGGASENPDVASSAPALVPTAPAMVEEDLAVEGHAQHEDGAELPRYQG